LLEAAAAAASCFVVVVVVVDAEEVQKESAEKWNAMHSHEAPPFYTRP
jgi:hypothetical protein